MVGAGLRISRPRWRLGGCRSAVRMVDGWQKRWALETDVRRTDHRWFVVAYWRGARVALGKWGRRFGLARCAACVRV